MRKQQSSIDRPDDLSRAHACRERFEFSSKLLSCFVITVAVAVAAAAAAAAAVAGGGYRCCTGECGRCYCCCWCCRRHHCLQPRCCC